MVWAWKGKHSMYPCKYVHMHLHECKCSRFQIWSQFIALHRKGLIHAPISVSIYWAWTSKQESLNVSSFLSLTTCFASSYHTTHDFLSSCHHASACFLTICRVLSHPWSSLNLSIWFPHWPIQRAALAATLSWWNTSKPNQARAHTDKHAGTHSDMFICTLLAHLLTLKQFPQQREVADNNVFCYGWQR